MSWKLGIDIGGTNFFLGAVGENNTIIEHWEEPVGDRRSPEEVANAIKSGTDFLSEKLGERPIAAGAGIPAIIDHKSQIALRAPHFPNWQGEKIGEMLSNLLNLPVVVDNDANMAAYGEKIAGSGKNIDNFIFLTLGTGIGGGLVLNGELFRGDHGFDGEVGHIIIDPLGPKCACGSRGCFEMYAAGKSVPSLIKQLDEVDQKELKKLTDGKKFTAKLAYELAENGNSSALRLWEKHGFWLGIGIASLVNILGVGNIIIGGNVSRAFKFFSEKAKNTVLEYAHTTYENGLDLKIERSKLGHEAGIIGAASAKM